MRHYFGLQFVRLRGPQAVACLACSQIVRLERGRGEEQQKDGDTAATSVITLILKV